MTQATLELIHEAYQQALKRSGNIMQTIEALYEILYNADVPEEDSQAFDNFIDGLRGCLQYRRHTHTVTNQMIYISITFMYIVHWLNSQFDFRIDINWTARRKSLESDLTKILLKSISPTDSNYSASIRDRFGLRGIVLNNIPSEEAEELIYHIYDAILGIIAGKNRKMRKQFVSWYENNPNVPEPDKKVIQCILDMPFGVNCIKDFIQKPKPNGYQTLQFTMSIQMYSSVLAGCDFEVQLRTMEMHNNATDGSASHEAYKYKSTEKISTIFTVDDFSQLNIVGYTGNERKEQDTDGFHFPKVFSDRRISDTLVR